MTHGPSIGAVDLLRSWRDAGLVAREDLPEIAEAIATAAASDEPPLHLKILAGVGTLVGTLFFLGFLAAADDSLGDGRGIALLAVFKEDAAQVLVAPIIDHIPGGKGRRAVHAHIQGGVVHIGEAAPGFVQLR